MLSIANASKAHWGQGVEKHFNQFFLPNLHCVIISEMSPVGAISVLQFFLSTLRSGRHRADVHRTSCALIFALMRISCMTKDEIRKVCEKRFVEKQKNRNSDKTLFIAFINCYILSSKSSQTLENAKFIASEFALMLSLVLYPFPSCYELS